jgi:hypothetical protein
MIDFDMGRIKRTEPVEDKFRFMQLAKVLLPKHGHLGGGDVWHLMAALQLKSQVSKTIFVSFDRRLIAAAEAEGLEAVDGNGLDSNQLSAQLKASKKSAGWVSAVQPIIAADSCMSALAAEFNPLSGSTRRWSIIRKRDHGCYRVFSKAEADA